MISVEDAICRVLQHTAPLELETLSLTPALLGRTLSTSLHASSPFPSFPASIMDGYAVRAPLQAGVYNIKQQIFAGDDTTESELGPNEVAYITTGAMLPVGANAVVKIEDTEKVDADSVKVNVSIEVGNFVREIGSDIALGEEVLAKGTYLGPTELGLLATTGYTKVSCYAKPTIGVLSTGNELVEAHEETTGAQIRDSNRISLIAAFQEEGFDVMDLGIMRDSKEDLKALLLDVSSKCDVIVTSGGVSMGAADFIKPILNEIGTVHFNKLNMKPGKPTTFATFTRKDQSRSGKTLFFGLPGNPVSCLVTKTLFVDPALKRLQGLPSDQCLHPQVFVKLVGESGIKLDPERAEYHRVNISFSPSRQETVLIARSTGNQRSSRLLSMKSANGLLILPRGPGMIEIGSIVPALLVRPLGPPACEVNFHQRAARLDYPNLPTSSPAMDSNNHSVQTSKGNTAKDCCNNHQAKDSWKTIKTGLLTISDRASTGVYKDESGPEMAKLLKAMSESPDYPLDIDISATALVPDDPDAIKSIIEEWTNPSSPNHVDFLLTSGGTGFGIRDNTPETIKPLLHREAPGIAQSLLNEGLKFTPLAVLSRPVVGTRHSTFIATLPGSVKAVRENITALKVLLPRIFELIKTGDCHK